jgi:O6-methylguanine-DNA--protein-cysteine methyltransferase
MFQHGLSNDCMKNSKNKSMRFVQGHHHSRFEIRYWANTEKLFWGVTSGSLVDYKALAFEYGKLILDKPIIGVTMIINSYPILIPMVLNSRGRWIEKLP